MGVPETPADQVPLKVGVDHAFEKVRERGRVVDFRARHGMLGHEVLLRRDLTFDSYDERDRAALESRFLAARRFQAELRHPGILGLKEVFREGDAFYSVFDRLPRGQTLRARVASWRGSSPPLSEFRLLCEGIVGGLAAVHQAGWVHGTVHPDNYIVDQMGEATAIDLGIASPARAADGHDADEPRPLLAVFRYMAPEIAEASDGGTPLTIAADLWSLGTMLFEARYGRHPIRSMPESGSYVNFVAALLTGEVEFPPASSDHESEEEELLRDWLAGLLRRDPAKRPSSAVEALRSLDAILAHLDDRPPLARCFVATPFAEEFDALWREIRLVCAESRVDVVRGDERFTQEDIWGEVADSIASSDFLIAVCARDRGQFNPNVMLEVGFARALRKPTLLLTDDVEALPFDLRTQRALVFTRDQVASPALREQLTELIRAMLGRI